MTINRKIKRTLPFLRLLKQVPDKQKSKTLRSFPTFVVDDMVEILYNLLYKNVHVKNTSHRATLFHNKRTLSNIVNAHKQKNKRKQLVYKQTGGFIGALLPVVTSVLSGLLTHAAL